MDDLIDRKALLREMETLYNKRAVEATMTGNRACCVSWNDAVYLVTVAPTIKVEPKHGHWEHPEGWDNNKYRCSECHLVWGFFHGGPRENGAYYCPHCGSNMGEVEIDDK